jgi:arylsulfatase A-like enzyme
MALDYEGSPVTGNGLCVPLEMDTYFERLQKAGYFTIMTGKDHIRGHDPGPGPDGTNVMAEMGWDACLGTDDVWEFAKTGEPEEPYGYWLEEQGVYEGMAEEYGAFPFKSVAVPPMGALVPTLSSLCYNDDYDGDLMLGMSDYCPNRSVYTDEYRYDLYMLEKSKEVFQEKYLANNEAVKKPWMWLVNFNGGHPPWIMTTKAWENTADRVFSLPQNAPEFAKNPEKASFLQKSYAAMVEDTDDMSNALMDFLDEKSPGGLANMVVMLTGDHGEMLGDHDRTRKQTQHEGSCRVPLVISGPGINVKNKVIKTPVSTVDVPGTIMAIAGATPADTMTAKSLLPLIESGVPSREIVEAGLTFRAVDIRMRWKQYNDTHTLKLYCCPIGCPKSATTADAPGQAQAGLVIVNDEGDGEDVTAQGHAEAAELLATLSQSYQDVCGPLVL